MLADGRGGRTLVHDPHGRVTATLDLGDASGDIQTTTEGKIWVSYFDEGVFGGGVGSEGVVCFDSAGSPVFRFAEFAARHCLPMIADCYAMNVSSEGEVWLNYYMDFPLVRLQAFTLREVRQHFGPMGHAFAIRGTKVIYLRNGQFMVRELEQPQERQAATAVDEQGLSLSLNRDAGSTPAARGSSFLVETETALYELV